MRPIDADALKTKINTTFFSEIGKIIDNEPTIESIESMTIEDLVAIAERYNMYLSISLLAPSKEEGEEVQ